jgi:hypothetical protein
VLAIVLGIAACLVSMLLVVLLVAVVLRNDGLRNRAMGVMHWMTGR